MVKFVGETTQLIQVEGKACPNCGRGDLELSSDVRRDFCLTCGHRGLVPFRIILLPEEIAYLDYISRKDYYTRTEKTLEEFEREKPVFVTSDREDKE